MCPQPSDQPIHLLCLRGGCCLLGQIWCCHSQRLQSWRLLPGWWAGLTRILAFHIFCFSFAFSLGLATLPVPFSPLPRCTPATWCLWGILLPLSSIPCWGASRLHRPCPRRSTLVAELCSIRVLLVAGAAVPRSIVHPWCQCRLLTCSVMVQKDPGCSALLFGKGRLVRNVSNETSCSLPLSPQSAMPRWWCSPPRPQGSPQRSQQCCARSQMCKCQSSCRNGKALGQNRVRVLSG